jgi:hypothetical protein
MKVAKRTTNALRLHIGRRVSYNPCLKADFSSTGSALHLNVDDGTEQGTGGGDDHGAFRGFVANRL